MFLLIETRLLLPTMTRLITMTMILMFLMIETRLLLTTITRLIPMTIIMMFLMIDTRLLLLRRLILFLLYDLQRRLPLLIVRLLHRLLLLLLFLQTVFLPKLYNDFHCLFRTVERGGLCHCFFSFLIRDHTVYVHLLSMSTTGRALLLLYHDTVPGSFAVAIEREWLCFCSCSFLNREGSSIHQVIFLIVNPFRVHSLLSITTGDSSPSTSFCRPLFLSSHNHQLQIFFSSDPTTIWIR